MGGSIRLERALTSTPAEVCKSSADEHCRACDIDRLCGHGGAAPVYGPHLALCMVDQRRRDSHYLSVLHRIVFCDEEPPGLARHRAASAPLPAIVDPRRRARPEGGGSGCDLSMGRGA